MVQNGAKWQQLSRASVATVNIQNVIPATLGIKVFTQELLNIQSPW